MPTMLKEERIEARVTHQQKQRIARAATLRGRSITDFVVSCAAAAADQAIQEHEAVRLSLQDSKRFIQAILHPPKPNALLMAAAKRYAREVVGAK
ncbi:MAG: DUF1778 domain-containing protein [Verrucomicrobia bacterium]|nr:DUF1778 domain-containing protein [Verrucomicrobiota bacterium]